MILNFWTDGAATMRNVNGEYVREAGGWAYAMVNSENRLCYENYGKEEETTNNRMELMAIYQALDHYYLMDCSNDRSDTINIYSDSAYCINIFTKWIKGWKDNGWCRGKKKEPIENVELIKKIWELIEEISSNYFCTINFIKVAGHSNEKWNNYVDNLAVKAKIGELVRKEEM